MNENDKVHQRFVFLLLSELLRLCIRVEEQKDCMDLEEEANNDSELYLTDAVSRDQCKAIFCDLFKAITIACYLEYPARA